MRDFLCFREKNIFLFAFDGFSPISHGTCTVQTLLGFICLKLFSFPLASRNFSETHCAVTSSAMHASMENSESRDFRGMRDSLATESHSQHNSLQLSLLNVWYPQSKNYILFSDDSCHAIVTSRALDDDEKLFAICSHAYKNFEGEKKSEKENFSFMISLFYYSPIFFMNEQLYKSH